MTTRITRRGFTLVELLVVIAIIAILAAILFPVFAKAQEKSRQTDCSNNQRQIAISILAYCQDNEEILPNSSIVWQAAAMPPKSLRCQTSKLTMINSYAYNSGASDKPLGEIADETKFFLTADGKVDTNIAVFMNDLDERHTGKLIASFADGHIELRSAQGLLDAAPGSLKKYVFVSGRNNVYQLGNNTTTPASVNVPTQVSIAPVEMTKISAGLYHIIGVDSGGQLIGWAQNTNGQLGRGNATNAKMPILLGATDAKAFYAKGNYTFRVTNDGTTWAAGLNSNGQLGINSTVQQNTWVAVPGYSNLLDIGAGYSHSLFVKSDGTVWGCGLNSNRQLADNSVTQRNAPVQMLSAVGVPLTGVKKVAAGLAFSVMLKNDGTVWCVGRPNEGENGDGTVTQRLFPVQVQVSAGPPIVYLTGVTDITAGCYFALARKSDGTVWAWGQNTSGQLGDGSTTNRNRAVQVAGLTGVTAIRTGYNFSLAVMGDGTVRACGQNTYGQLGDASTTNRSAPVTMQVTKVLDVYGGQDSSVVLTTE